MKITMNIDCTPEEARAFFGLPDLKPMQDELMQVMRNRLMAGVAAMDPAETLRAWIPATAGLDAAVSSPRWPAANGTNNSPPRTLRRLPPAAGRSAVTGRC